VPAPRRPAHEGVHADGPEPSRFSGDPQERRHPHGEGAGRQDRPRTESVDGLSAERRGEDPDRRRPRGVQGEDGEGEAEVSEQVQGEEAGPEAHRRVPGHLVGENRARRRVGERAQERGEARWRRRRRGRLVLAREERARHHPRRRGGRCEPGEREAGPVAARAVEQEPGAQSGEARAQRAHRGPRPEVPPAQPLRDELAHPRGPGVAPGDAERRRDGRDREEQELPRRWGEREKRQCREREEGEARGRDRRDGDALAPERRREPRRRDLDGLGEERERAEQAHLQRGAAEVQRPAGEDGAARAGDEDLGEDPLERGGGERAAETGRHLDGRRAPLARGEATLPRGARPTPGADVGALPPGRVAATGPRRVAGRDGAGARRTVRAGRRAARM